MNVAASHTSVVCDDQPVLSADELAPGNPEFSAEDRKYTVRRIHLVGDFLATFTALSGTHSIRWWAVALKIDVGMVLGLSGAKFSDIVQGGSSISPNANDVLGIWSWSWATFEGLNASNSFGAVSHAQHFDIDIKATRRMDGNECIAMLWGMDEMDVGLSLPSASHFNVEWTYASSVLYSESPKR